MRRSAQVSSVSPGLWKQRQPGQTARVLSLAFRLVSDFQPSEGVSCTNRCTRPRYASAGGAFTSAIGRNEITAASLDQFDDLADLQRRAAFLALRRLLARRRHTGAAAAKARARPLSASSSG